MALQRILVTGGNKGIGLAIVKSLLARGDVEAVLCARDARNGEEALRAILAENPAYAGRISYQSLDVCSEESVAAAADAVRTSGGSLYAIVNNAGIATGAPAELVATNLFGVKSVCDAFAGLIQEGGRVINISSGSAVMFLEKASEGKKALFTAQDLSWQTIEDQVDVFLQLLGGPNGAEACESAGFGKEGDMYAYGFSKCALNAYTISLARELAPRRITVNACSPGLIKTDLFIPMAAARGQTLDELAVAFNALPVEKSTVSTLRLLFTPQADIGTGKYFGSDGLRSPMAKYRRPGDPEYDGVAHGH